MQTLNVPITDSANLTITGFMGTGKSTVGSIFAERLGRPFVDMDERLEAELGKTIAEVFADDGEEAFRLAEARLCQQLAGETGLVIATGGGALVNDQNRQVLAESGPIVCLTAGIDTVLERVEAFEDRPLLPGDPRRKEAKHRAAVAQPPRSLRTHSPPCADRRH